MSEVRKEWYEDMDLDSLKTLVDQNIKSAARSFIAIGYYLKQIRDRELYLEDGYETIWEFAQTEYGLSKSAASRHMSINDRFSQNGNSPIVQEQYRDFSKSQLQEMLYLDTSQLEAVTPETRILEIRQLRQDAGIEVQIPGQMDIRDFPEYLPCKTETDSLCQSIPIIPVIEMDIGELTTCDIATDYEPEFSVVCGPNLIPLADHTDCKDRQEDDVLTEAMEYICDNLCRYPRDAADQDQLESICEECRMERILYNIQGKEWTP